MPPFALKAPLYLANRNRAVKPCDMLSEGL